MYDPFNPDCDDEMREESKNYPEGFFVTNTITNEKRKYEDGKVVFIIKDSFNNLTGRALIGE
jgi:hypothetical protein